MANRQGRIKAVIEKDIRDIIMDISQNNNLGFVTVSKVEVSDDYSNVKVFVSFYKNELSNFEKLKKKTNLIKRELAHKVNLRRAPNVQILLDRGFTYESRIEKALEKESKELEEMQANSKDSDSSND